MRLPLLIPGLATAVVLSAAPIPLVTLGVPVTEDFNSLAVSGTSAVLPSGWSLAEAGSSANSTYAAGGGGSTTGNTFSFGTGTAADRALGMLRTASLISTIGVAFLNQTGEVITGLAIRYAGEQWRLGAAGRADRLDFAYSLDATSLATGLWTNVDALDFSSPNTGPATGALDGNAPANTTVITHALASLNILPGATFWLRWSDFDAAGADDGLAIDHFSLSASGPPPVVDTVPDTLPMGGVLAVAGLLGAIATRKRPGAALS